MFKEKIKKSGFSILITILFLVALILLNVFVGMLTERFFIKVDLTDTGLYTLSERAANFLRDVDEPVDIIVLAEESAWRASSSFDLISNILRNYAASSGGYLRIQYVNPDLNTFNGPKYNNSLADLKEAYSELENMTRNDLIILSGRRATRLSAVDLFAQSQDQWGRTGIVGVRADQELISALIYVLNEQISRVVFIDNHGEAPKLVLGHYFERTGYTLSTMNLATEDIPYDTTVLVTAAPQFDFLNEEIIKLEDYMLHGGNLIVLYDPQLPSTPNLTNFLAEWGLTVEDKLIFDDEYSLIPGSGLIAVHVVTGDLPFTAGAEDFTYSVRPLGAFLARPITSEGTRGGFNMQPLISTFSSSSYAKDTSGGNITTHERERGDESGPFNVAYNVRRLVRDRDGNQVHANLILAGATLFDDDFLAMYGDSFYNIMLIVELATDLNPFGGRVFIPAKEFTDRLMLVSAGGARMILIVMVIIIPLAIIAAGVVVWRRRRHR